MLAQSFNKFLSLKLENAIVLHECFRTQMVKFSCNFYLKLFKPTISLARGKNQSWIFVSSFKCFVPFSQTHSLVSRICSTRTPPSPAQFLGFFISAYTRKYCSCLYQKMKTSFLEKVKRHKGSGSRGNLIGSAKLAQRNIMIYMYTSYIYFCPSQSHSKTSKTRPIQAQCAFISFFQQETLGKVGHLVLEKQLDHLEVLVVDGHEECAPSERVAAVDVDLPALPALFQHPEGKGRHLLNVFSNRSAL